MAPAPIMTNEATYDHLTLDVRIKQETLSGLLFIIIFYSSTSQIYILLLPLLSFLALVFLLLFCVTLILE